MFQNPVGWSLQWAESTAVLMPRPRKLNSGTRKRFSINRQKITSSAKLERERKSGRKEKIVERREWLQRRREQGEKKEMLRRERGEEGVAKAKPEEAKKLKSKEDRRKERMREKKVKKVLMKGSLNAGKVVPKAKVEKAVRVAGPKWNGVRENERHEDRPGKARQEKKRLKSVKARNGTVSVDILDETEDLKPSFPEAVVDSLKMDKLTKVKAKDRGERDQPDMTASSSSEVEQTDSDDEGQHLIQQRTRTCVKRRGKQTIPPASSSDEDEEPLVHRRRKRSKIKTDATPPPLTSDDEESKAAAGNSEEIKISSERHTLNHLLAKQKRKDDEIQADLTETSEEEPDEVQSVGGGLRGGAGDGYEDVFLEAIQKSGEAVELDRPTIGDGSCFSHAIVQQCQRRPVKLFLQSRGITVNDYVKLKEEVAQFIQDNIDTDRVRNMRQMFTLSQMNMHLEKLPRRSWRQYWTDMRSIGATMELEEQWRVWGDDLFVQATCWYLDLPLRIIWANDRTRNQIVSDNNDLWTPLAEGEVRPLLYVGYIVRQHYQSLLPLVEEPLPLCVAQPAVDKALQDALHAILEQVTQVSSSEN